MSNYEIKHTYKIQHNTYLIEDNIDSFVTNSRIWRGFYYINKPVYNVRYVKLDKNIEFLKNIKANNFTIMCKFKLNEYGKWARLFDFGDGSPNNNILLTMVDVSNTLELQIYNNTTKLVGSEFNTKLQTYISKYKEYTLVLIATNRIINNGDNTENKYRLILFDSNNTKVIDKNIKINNNNLDRPLILNNSYINKSNWNDNGFINNGYIKDFKIINYGIEESDIQLYINNLVNTTRPTFNQVRPYDEKDKSSLFNKVVIDMYKEYFNMNEIYIFIYDYETKKVINICNKDNVTVEFTSGGSWKDRNVINIIDNNESTNGHSKLTAPQLHIKFKQQYNINDVISLELKNRIDCCQERFAKGIQYITFNNDNTIINIISLKDTIPTNVNKDNKGYNRFIFYNKKFTTDSYLTQLIDNSNVYVKEIELQNIVTTTTIPTTTIPTTTIPTTTFPTTNIPTITLPTTTIPTTTIPTTTIPTTTIPTTTLPTTTLPTTTIPTTTIPTTTLPTTTLPTTTLPTTTLPTTTIPTTTLPTTTLPTTTIPTTTLPITTLPTTTLPTTTLPTTNIPTTTIPTTTIPTTTIPTTTLPTTTLPTTTLTTTTLPTITLPTTTLPTTTIPTTTLQTITLPTTTLPTTTIPTTTLQTITLPTTTLPTTTLPTTTIPKKQLQLYSNDELFNFESQLDKDLTDIGGKTEFLHVGDARDSLIDNSNSPFKNILIPYYNISGKYIKNNSSITSGINLNYDSASARLFNNI